MSYPITNGLRARGELLYRVTGEVIAEDGSSYRPDFYGDWFRACSVAYAIRSGAIERGDSFEVSIIRPDGSVYRVDADLSEAGIMAKVRGS